MDPIFEGLAPLPPRPGPGHILYHYILKTGPFCVALFDFEAENDDELDLKAGDGIKLDSDISDEWFEGSIDDRRGIFPKNCVEVEIPLPALPEPELTPIGTCTAIYFFEALESNELTVNEGDSIDILDFVDDDWIKGKLGDKVGIFPRSYASFGDENIEEPLEEILDEETHSVNVFYDFEAGADDELSLSVGNMVTVISTVGEEWIRGRFGGKEGIFPACFVPAIPDHWNIPEYSETFIENLNERTEESSSSDDNTDRIPEISESGNYTTEPTLDLGSVQAIADFNAENEFVISVKTGDIIRITARLNELWLVGECNGNAGLIPINFVKWLDTAPEPKIIGNPAATERAALELQDTLKPSEKTKETEQAPAPVSSGFSEGNPFAQEFGIESLPPTQEIFTADPPPPPDLGLGLG